MNPSKFIIYQLLPRLFGNTNEHCVPDGSYSENGSGKFDDISATVIKGLKELSITHIWLTGVIRHSTQGDPSAKGKAGSPFAIKDYYDVNPYLANKPQKRMDEFHSLVKRLHQASLKVILDFIPNHVSREYASLFVPLSDDNFYPGKIHDYDWSDTMKLNYSNRDTWKKMRDILLYWCSKGIDGFRCDMVELVPVDFWNWCIPQIKEEYPSTIFIAEIYQTANYLPYTENGRFDFLYDKSGFYDQLRKITAKEAPASSLTGVWQSLGSLQPKMLNFLENHDEQRIASPFYLGNPSKSFASLAVSLYFNTAPFMVYFGQELGEKGMDTEGFSGCDGKTSIYDFWSVSSVRRWLSGTKEGDSTKYLTIDENETYFIYKKMLSQAMSIPAIKCGRSYDLEYANPKSEWFDPQTDFAFLRHACGELFLCVANFSQYERIIKVNVPSHAYEYFGIEGYPSGLVVEVKVNAYSGVLHKL